jgi:hypothetical protein
LEKIRLAETLDLIIAADKRYSHEAYVFLRALDEQLAPWCHASKIGRCSLSPIQLVPIPIGPTTSSN